MLHYRAHEAEAEEKTETTIQKIFDGLPVP